MPSHNDLRDYMAQVTRPTPEQEFQAKAQAEVGRRAQMASDHPGFQIWTAHLDELRAQAQRARDGKVRLMVEGDALGEALVKLKLDVARLDGEIRALGQAIDLIPELIRRGQHALERLPKPA